MVKTGPQNETPRKWVYRGWPVDAVGLVSLLAFLLIVFQYASASILVSTLGRRWDRMGEYLEFLASLGWRGGDLLLLGLILATFLTILVLDLATGHFGMFLRLVFSNERRAIVFTTFCCLVAVRFYLGAGKMPWGADASYHGVYTWIAANGFREGIVPVWTPLLSVGTWFVQFLRVRVRIRLGRRRRDPRRCGWNDSGPDSASGLTCQLRPSLPGNSYWFGRTIAPGRLGYRKATTTGSAATSG